MTQPSLNSTQPTRTFGPAYEPALDGARIRKQHEVIRDLMLARPNWRWLSLGEMAKRTGYPEASISAQLRHLRKQRFGGYKVDKRPRGDGLWEYRVR